MKKPLIYILLLLTLPTGLFAQVTVTGSTGADATYPTLALAFTAINGTAQTGNNIDILITGSTTETASAALNAGTWTSINIHPAGSGLTISGNLAAPLMDLNGADNVTIDGSMNGTKDLIIENTNTSNTTGTSTIRFINDATGNNIKNCILKGSETAAASGILFFSTTTGTTGNDGNIIDINDITSSVSANRPINCIYSSGTAAKDNSGNIISNNNIYDNLNRAIASNGIYLSSNTTSCTVSGNSFYETSSFAPSSAGAYYIVRIENITGTDFSVKNNFFGGTAAQCGGSPWIKTSTQNNSFTGIYLKAGTGSANSVQGNIIRNMDWSNSGAATWVGINIAGGDVNLGTETGNTIGAITGTGAVLIKAAAAHSNIYCINISSYGTVDCRNNNIGSITVANTDANGSNFFGITKTFSDGTTTISNNIIGSTSTANSILVSSPSRGSSQSVQGIYNAGKGAITISNNIIANLTNGTTNTTLGTVGKINGIFSSSGTNTISDNIIHDLTISNSNNLQSLNASVCGISLSGPTIKNVTGNTIYNLLNNNDTFRGYIQGLFFTGSTAGNNISRNLIHSISVRSSSATIFGIQMNSGSSTYSNNIIALGGNTATNIFGIYESGLSTDINSIYFNTVSICGSAVSGTNRSFALYSAVNTHSRNFRNNILVNNRSTAGTANLHYALYIATPGGTLTCDYNDYWVTGTGGILGYYGGNKSTLPIVTSQDVASLSTDPLFVTSCGTAPTDYIPSAQTIIAQAGTGITTDYAGNPRDANYPSMGSFEIVLLSNIEVYQANLLQARYLRLKDAFDAFNSGMHNSGDFEIRIRGNVNEPSSAVLNSSGTGSADYTSILIFPAVPGITISGNIAAPLIDLKGADNIIIDGRVNATGAPNSLTIANTSIDDTAITSTIRMIDGATDNIVRYCNLRGSATGSGSGILLFSTSGGTTGNSDNIIENNDIKGADNINRPLNAIYSGGTADFLNSGDTIRNNNIYDFLSPGLSSSGIYAGTYSTDWTISGNSFYETTSFIPSASMSYYIVRLNNTGGNYSVSGNFIGGSAPLCGGTACTKTNAFNNAFYGIYLSAGTGTTNNIQNNTIQNIDWSNSLNGAWTGIYTGRGDVNIGTAAGNIIGAETGTGSILLTSKTTGNNVYGINIASPGTVSCLNNKTGAITIANADANGSNFYGINKTSSAGITNISNNTIGSTSTPNSIIATSPSTGNAQAIRGIYNAGTGAVTISNNTIANLTNGTTNTNGATLGKINGIFSSSGTNTISGNSIHDLTIANANNQTNLNASMCGISLSGPTLKNVTGNTIYNLSNNYASFTGSIIGLYFTGSAGVNSVSLNYIHDLKVTSSSAFIYGIKINTGSSTLTNNIITLGGNSATTLYGIYETGTAGFTDSLNFNTVYIAGSPASGTNKSYALYSAVTTNNRIFINNIFANARSTSGGSNLHYAAYIVSSGGSITCNYNNYWVSGTGGILGYYAANKSTLPIVTGQDGLSLAINPTFTGSAGAPEDYMTGVELPGLDGTAVRTDFGGNPRIVPTMGAWEGFIAKWKGAVSDDWNTAANWTSGIVPAPEANILFDPVPLNNLVMDQDRSVRKITDSTAYIIVTNGHKLTLKGQLFFSSGSKLDASAINSTVEIISDSIHTIDNIQFLNNRIYNLIIGNTTGVSLNSDFTVDNSMTINAGTRLYINAPNLLTVTGTLTNNAGVNGLIIKSSGNGIDAKLINNSPSVNASVELLLSGGVSPTGKRIHSFVPPVQSMTVGPDIAAVRTSLNVTYFDGYLLYWDEAKTVTSQSQGWQYFDGYNNTTPLPSGAITSGMGYYFYLTQDDTVTFKGSLNGSTHTFNLKYTPGNKDPGGNLIGNPYPCNYDLTGVPEFMGPASDNVDNTVYFYTNGQYKVYNVSTGVGDIGYNNIVPPMQGFFVNITGPKSLSFPATSKTSAAAGVPRSKGAMDSENSNIRKIKMILKNDLAYDEAYICLIDKATSGFDGDYDGYKLFGSDNTIPLIYSDFNSVKYAINSIQEPDSGAVIIPLTVELTTGGTYKINFPEFENLDGIKVVLKHGTEETRISKGTTYSFTSAAGTFSNFEIIIGDYTKSTLSEIPVRSQFNTWYNDGYLYIKCSEEVQADKGKLIIYDSQGKVVLNNNLINISPGNTIQLPVNLTRGLYIINVVVGQKPSTSKIVVF